MKATELRIGNEIMNIKGTQFKVLSDDFSTIESFPENYKGIPLTEGWLVKFGFKKGSVMLEETEYYLEGNFYIWIDKNGFIDFDYDLGYGQANILIKYVHQLQNLYFALTGEELTI